MAETREYIEQHGVRAALQSGVVSALKNKSLDPLGDIIASLQRAKDSKRFGAGAEISGIFLVVGCSKGIGLELCKIAKLAGLIVYGTCRKATEELLSVGIEKVIEDVELANDDVGARLQTALGDLTIDTVVFNAAIGDASNGEDGSMIAKGMSTQGMNVNMENMRRMFEVNTFGLMKVAQAIMGNIRKPGGRWCTIGTIAGSFELTLDGPFSAGEFAPFLAYRSSKCAAMMITQCLASTLKKDSVAVSCIHPGVGATDLTTGGMSPDGKPIIPPGMEAIFKWPDELAKGVFLAVKNTTLENTGAFLDGQYGDGVVSVPW